MNKLLFSAVLCAVSCAFADTPKLYVAEMGNDVTGDGSWDAPFATISNAVHVAMTNGANNGTVISVQPGTYPGGTRMEYWNKTYWETSSRAIQIRAQKRVGGVDVDNPNPRETVIDGQHKAAGVWLNGSTAMICGFTITNGVWQRMYQLRYSNSPIGGSGVYLSSGATASNMIVCCCITKPDDRPLPTPEQGQFAAVHATGANSTIVDSFIYNCTNETTAVTQSGELNAGGIRLDGKSFARRCVVSNCWAICGKSGGNHRGGGVYMNQNSGATLDSCQILDCVGKGVSGGGICLLSGVTVTNCLISGCQSNSGGGGISAEYGCGLIVDTTITNCWITGGTGCGLTMSPGTTAANQIIRRCKIVDCNKGGLPLYQTYGTVEDCLIENNAYAHGVVQISGTRSLFRNNVVRNNRPTNNSALAYVATGAGTSTVERCWFTGNTCATWMGVVEHSHTYNLHFVVDGCVIAGNVGGYGVRATDGTSFGPTSGELKDLPEAERHPTTRVYNTTIAHNTLNGQGIYFYHLASELGGPQYLAATNCLVVANTNSSGSVMQAFGFDDTVKARLAEHPEQIAYCAMATGTGANLPADPQGVAHNQIGRVGVRGETTVPKGLAMNNAYPLPSLMAEGATDMGDGSYTIKKYADWGVKITANNVQKRVLGAAPDIGASECKPNGMSVIVR